MPQVVDIIRQRRKRSVYTARGLIFRVALASVSLILLIAALTFALVQAEITADLPAVTALENHFGAIGRERYAPVRFFDRSGEVLLFQAFNVEAEDPRWLYIQDDGPIDIQEHTLHALLAAVDPDYFERSSPTTLDMLRDFMSIGLQGSANQPSANIPRALVETQLLPLKVGRQSDSFEQARIHLLAQEVDRHFPKSLILEWFINSIDFGRDAYGFDAAALVYLGKHASDLNLAESALLAPIILQPTLNPFDAPEECKERQERLLETMVEFGWITVGQARIAKQEILQIRDPGTSTRTPLQEILTRWLQERLGRQALNRSGLTVYTTIDAELQLQAECTMATQLRRLDSGLGNESVAAADGSVCLAAGLLPPLRPRDQGMDHQIEGGAFVVLDPQSGEILALAGMVDLELSADGVLSPLIYLTAFSQGYSPGSMILDLPVQELTDQASGELDSSLEEAHGPVSIRTALANMYPLAVEQMLRIVGEDGFLRIVRNLGIPLTLIHDDLDPGLDRWKVRLLDLTAAYGVLAYQGQQVGASVASSLDVRTELELQPEILHEVEDGNQRLIYQYVPKSSAVVSPQLAYLINDILKDEQVRWPLYGSGNPFEIGRPAAAIGSLSKDGREVWAVGYTPTRVVGVWMGNLGESQPQSMEVNNSAAAVWHAVAQYATRELPAQDWSTPPGISRVEVCDPSGLLPTVYCPVVVREVFLPGTEPITYDNLYQPFQLNGETGKLATLYTPLEQVEEQVYLVPPPEALAWAEIAGIEQPPKEYDTLIGEPPTVSGVEIRSPTAFSFVRGDVVVRGQANSDDFDYYRIQYGEGLNPTQWVQVGDEYTNPVQLGQLVRWDTSELDGLYTLQLIVVGEDGQLATAAVNLTIDNKPPDLVVILPEAGQRIDSSQSDGIVLQVNAEDDYGVASVLFYIDDRLLSTLSNPPFSTRWREGQPGEHRLEVEAVDLAGNHSIRGSVSFSIVDR